MSKIISFRTTQLKPFINTDEENTDNNEDGCLESRMGHSIVRATKEGRLVMFGGRRTIDNKPIPEVVGIDLSRISNGKSGRFIKLNIGDEHTEIKIGGQIARYSYHSHTMSHVGQSVYIQGGYASSAGDDIPFWDQHFYQIKLHGLELINKSSQPPTRSNDPRRRGHSTITFNNNFYIIGGWGPQADWWRTDIDRFSVESDSWSTIQCRCTEGSIPNVAYHSTILLPASGEVVLFGGYVDESMMFKDRILKSQTKPKPTPTPFKVVGLYNNSQVDLLQTSPSDIAKGRWGEAGQVVFCGNAISVLNLNHMKWTRKIAIGHIPEPRANHSAILLSPKLMILSGGSCGSHLYNDCYILDTTLWMWTKLECNSVMRPVANHTATIIHGLYVLLGGKTTSDDSSMFCVTALVADIIEIYKQQKNKIKIEALMGTITSVQMESGSQQFNTTKPASNANQQACTSRLLIPKKPTPKEIQIEEEMNKISKVHKKLDTPERDELIERLYGRLEAHRDAIANMSKRKYLQPLFETNIKRSSAEITKRLHEYGVAHQTANKESLLRKSISTWKGNGLQGQWVTGDYQEVDERRKKNISRAKHSPPTIAEQDHFDEVNRRFYEDRKPTSDVSRRKGIQLFQKYNPQKDPARKFKKSEIEKLNEKFHNKGVADKEAAKANASNTYIKCRQSVFKKQSPKDWNKTVERLYQQKPK